MGQMAGAIPAAVSTEWRKLGGVGNALCAVGSFACELLNEQRPPNTCGHFKLCHTRCLNHGAACRHKSAKYGQRGCKGNVNNSEGFSL